MFKRILFPTDFSKDRNLALHHAFQALGPDTREVIVQHVVNNFFGPHSHWASLFDVHELQKQMDFHVETEIIAPLRDDVKKATTVRPLMVQGKPPEEICKVAHQEMVDLIVMGSTRGVTTMKVARSATRPVLAIPIKVDSNKESKKSQKPLRPHFGHAESILVATDFSHQSKKVTDYAFRLKKAFDCQIHLVYAIKIPAALHRVLRPDQVASSLSKSREWVEMQARNVIPEEFMSDPTVHVKAELGPTSYCILQAATEVDPSLIVIGAKGYSPIEQHFYGTTVDRVLTNAGHPVLTLRV